MRNEVWREALPRIVAGIAVLGVLLLILLLIQIREVLAALFLGTIIGVSLNPTVDRLARYRVPRAVSVLLVYGLVFAAISAFAYYAAIQIKDQSLQVDLEEVRTSYEEFREGSALPSAGEVERRLEELGSQALTGVLNQAFTVVSGVLFVFTTLFIALLFTLTQERLRERFFDFVPQSKRERANEVLHKLAHGLRRFVIAELVAMSTIGVVTYIGLTILGVKMALVLAALAFIGEAFPIVGPAFAAVPAVIIALLTGGLLQAVQVAVLYTLIQAFENYVVTPVVHGRQNRIPALLIFVALLIGGSLMGILGALLAVPAAVIIHILYFEFVQPWAAGRKQESPTSSAPS